MRGGQPVEASPHDDELIRGHDHGMLARLAAAYGLPANEYLRLALDAAERVVEAP